MEKLLTYFIFFQCSVIVGKVMWCIDRLQLMVQTMASMRLRRVKVIFLSWDMSLVGDNHGMSLSL